MTFKAMHGMAPNYIRKLISRRKSTGYSLRSSKKVMHEVASGKILPTLGGRAFCHAAPKLWNNLPSEISSLDSLSNFRCHVKTYLLNKFLICSRVFVSFFIIYHLLSFYFIFKSFYNVPDCNFYSFKVFLLSYCKAHLIMCHGKLRYIGINHHHHKTFL